MSVKGRAEKQRWIEGDGERARVNFNITSVNSLSPGPWWIKSCPKDLRHTVRSFSRSFNDPLIHSFSIGLPFRTFPPKARCHSFAATTAMDGKEPTLVPVAESIDAPVVAPHVDRPSSPAATQSLELPAGQPVRDGSSAPAKQLDQSAEECSAPAIEHDEEEAHSPVNVVLTQSSQSPRASLTMEGSPLPLSTEQAGQNSSSTTSMDDQASTRSSADGSNNRTSTYSSGVDWDELGRNEEQEAGKDTSDEVTVFQV